MFKVQAQKHRAVSFVTDINTQSPDEGNLSGDFFMEDILGVVTEEKKIKLLSIVGKYLYRLFLFGFATSIIGGVSVFLFFATNQFLGLTPGSEPYLTSPFYFGALLGQFIVFREIFMSNQSKGLAFLVFTGIGILAVIIIFSIF
jgi:hypothetical protein